MTSILGERIGCPWLNLTLFLRRAPVRQRSFSYSLWWRLTCWRLELLRRCCRTSFANLKAAISCGPPALAAGLALPGPPCNLFFRRFLARGRTVLAGAP